jgi:SAM-dependent methyltransferase
MDQAAAYREVARVLKPGGIFLNIFPSKWRPIEAQIFVPFGGVTKSKAYFRFWAALGIRNGFQGAMSPAEVAEDNARFARRGINYPTGGEINRMLAGIFSRNIYAEQSFTAHSPGRSRHIASLLRAVPPLRLLFRFAHTRVILSQK